VIKVSDKKRSTEPIKINGYILRNDYSELITEKFAKKYNVDITDWIFPFGYYNQYDGSVDCNGFIPDGTYVLIGKVSYPGKSRFSYHIITQFNFIQSAGVTLSFSSPFNGYPELPDTIPLAPKFPIFKVGTCLDFIQFKDRFIEISNTWLTKDEIQSKLYKLDNSTIEYKVYALKLALLRLMKE
jgi:hypothetical protein